MSIYKCHISYSIIVQLCVARNMRHRSAERYKDVAKVTTRCARKGFQLKYNPDFHWSNALYSLLNSLQLKDGSNITIINRDDSSGFRFSSFYTVPAMIVLCTCVFKLECIIARWTLAMLCYI